MAKKRVAAKKKETGSSPSTHEGNKMEKVLIENFVSLQKIMTNLAVKFENLSSQISNLLDLFEISAKTFAEKGLFTENKKVIEKLNSVIEQNKVIARGVALIHEKEVERRYPQPVQMQRPQYPIQQPLNRINPPEGYPKSPSEEFSQNQNLKR
jgi:hypothetical protein